MDHPNTSVLKTRFLFHLGKGLGNIELAPVDFATQSLEEELAKRTEFKPDKPTLFIAEGVLMYLQEADVERTLASLRQMVTGADLQFLFTCAEPGKHACGPLVKWYLKIKGEPLRWIKTQNRVAHFLQDNGYNTQTIIPPSELKKQYLSDYQGILHDGEYIAVAERKHTR